jgi:hydrogenase expression/formation protein HypC
VRSRYERAGTQMALVDFGGVDKEICLVFAPEAEVGDFVLVHAGFAIARLDEEDAAATFAALRDLAEVSGGLGADLPAESAGVPADADRAEGQ